MRTKELAVTANKTIKLVGAVFLFGIAMAFRNDVAESWLRLTLAIVAFGILGWGIAQIFLKENN